MSKELVINATPKGNRIAFLLDKKLVEYHFETRDSEITVGDIYLGTITKLAPNLNAAFVDIGQERDAFLHYHDLSPKIKSLSKYTNQLCSQRNASYKLSSFKIEPEIDKFGKIADVLKPNQRVLVQITKEPISTKGARLSCEISLAGRYMVLVPFNDNISLSRKITSKKERRRLTRLVESIKPKNFGVVVRTVAENRDVAELDRDLQELLKKWEAGAKEMFGARAGSKIIGELNRTSTLLRDLLNEDFDSIQVDDEDTYNEIKKQVEGFSPEMQKIINQYNGRHKLFEKQGIEKQIKALFGRTVSLPSGGYLVIEHTEALTVVDVNSGNSKHKLAGQDQESAALQVNMEAADELARQLRLRDIGGIIVVDFIDQRRGDNRKQLYQHMRDCMSTDRSKYSLLPLSKFGLMQITRMRVRPVLNITTMEKCPTCDGTGQITATILTSDQIEDSLNHLINNVGEKKISITLHPYLKAFFKEKGFLRSKQWKWFFKYKTWIKLQADSSMAITDYFFFNNYNEKIEV